MEKLCADGILFWPLLLASVRLFLCRKPLLAKIMNGFPQYSVCMQENLRVVEKSCAIRYSHRTLAEEIIDNIDRRRIGSVALPTGQRMAITMRAMQTSPMRIWLSTAYAMVRFQRHAVTYDSDADMITIEHSAHLRKGFALAAVCSLSSQPTIPACSPHQII